MLRQKLGNSILFTTRPAAKLLSWQQHYRCHFDSFVMYISGDKFEEHCFNSSRNILDSVFYYFSCTIYHVLTFLISIIQKHFISRMKKDTPKRKAPFFCILKSLSYNQQLLSFHRHFKNICVRGYMYVVCGPDYNVPPKKHLPSRYFHTVNLEYITFFSKLYNNNNQTTIYLPENREYTRHWPLFVSVFNLAQF